jgi:uncharacterized protein YecT (DUF1311 family)
MISLPDTKVHSVRILPLVLILIISAFALFAKSAHAEFHTFALVRCDETAGELIVTEDATEEVEKYKAPEGYQSKWLDQLVEYISPPDGASDDATTGTYRHKIGDWVLSCTLNGAVYGIIISPWSVNDMVMGECGGGDPDVELTVRRDKRLLARNLRLGGTCSTGPSDALGIGTVKLSEPQRVATLDDRKIPYADMPLLTKEKWRSMDDQSAAPSNAGAAELNFNAADKELNEVYRNLKGSLDPSKQTALVQDERKWLKGLDPGCRKSANGEAAGGSMGPTAFWQCKADTTKLRTEALRNWEQ